MKKKTKKKLKITRKNLRILFIAIWVIMIWRWVWNLLDKYILTEYSLISNILTIILWILILFWDDHKLNELK